MGSRLPVQVLAARDGEELFDGEMTCLGLHSFVPFSFMARLSAARAA